MGCFSLWMDSNGTKKPNIKGAPSKLDLFRFRKDSGYISSSPATSSTEGTVIRRSLSGARDRVTPPNKGSSSETSPEETASPELIGPVGPSFTVGETKMQRTLSHDSPQQETYQEEPTSPEVSRTICVERWKCLFVVASVDCFVVPTLVINNRS